MLDQLRTKTPIHRPLCTEHYLESTFGQWPFKCTKRCLATERRKHSVMLDAKEFTVWLQLVLVLDGHLPGCPWCGQPMRVGAWDKDGGGFPKVKKTRPRPA